MCTFSKINKNNSCQLIIFLLIFKDFQSILIKIHCIQFTSMITSRTTKSEIFRLWGPPPLAENLPPRKKTKKTKKNPAPAAKKNLLSSMSSLKVVNIVVSLFALYPNDSATIIRAPTCVRSRSAGARSRSIISTRIRIRGLHFFALQKKSNFEHTSKANTPFRTNPSPRKIFPPPFSCSLHSSPPDALFLLRRYLDER